MTDWLRDRVNEWLSDWRTEWLSDRVNDWLTEWTNDWQIGWLTEWQSDWVIDRVSYRLTEGVTDWHSDWIIDKVTEGFRDRGSTRNARYTVHSNIVSHCVNSFKYNEWVKNQIQSLCEISTTVNVWKVIWKFMVDDGKTL